MRNYQRVLIDGNAILNSTLLRGVDHDAGVVKVNEQGKKITVNSAGYGVFGFFDRLYEILNEFNLAPRQVVCVWDGRNAKVMRQGWLPTYKAGREKDPDVFVQVNAAREAVRHENPKCVRRGFAKGTDLRRLRPPSPVPGERFCFGAPLYGAPAAAQLRFCPCRPLPSR